MPVCYKLDDKNVPSESLFIKRDGEPPCRSACPAGVNAAAYVALIAQGKFKEALEVIRQRMPFPGICGRICHHPCETECNRGTHDKPVSIAALKRAAADYGRRKDNPKPIVEDLFHHSVAIIGSGPAGLTAAYDLRRKGYRVVVFEKENKPGGMLRAAIPFYRLPEKVVERDINDILDIGIEIKVNTEVGTDITLRELEMYFDAVLIAAGTQKSAMLKLEGLENEWVYWGLDFLRRAKSEYLPPIGENVLVIGGGNVAIDVARTSFRLGAERVTLACLEKREEMPAHPWEIEAAVEEGLKVLNCLGPKRIIGNELGKVVGVEMLKAASVYDENGKFNPVFVEGSQRIIEADTVIIAVGQTADLDFLNSVEGIELSNGRLIRVDEITLETGRSGIFACGDVVSGPKSIVEAVNAGHEAAESIHRYISGKNLKEGRIKQHRVIQVPEGIPIYDYERHVPQRPEAEVRKEDFREEKYGLTVEEAVAEARRCLNCGNCFICGDDCTIHITGGLCPVIRCNKNSSNGPCGGSSAEGWCEIDREEDCIWQLIYDLLKKSGRIENLKEMISPKNWSCLENTYLKNTAMPLGSVGSEEMLKLVKK
ncbi:MAG: FAD-dependent oxidoreductase [Clostridia bacterium]|nr:FAD-dependent oxidoreductase [Clostridia bacterium]